MARPLVAIVGRPNVGKSSLFNWLAGRRIAIVDPTAGVTRDRLAAPVVAGERTFDLVDTGGMGIEDVDDLTAEIEGQIEAAIEEAAVLLFVVDVRAGLVPLDVRVAERLRQVEKPVIVVVNKCDVPDLDAQAGEFYRFARGALVPVSAQNDRGKRELLGLVAASLPPAAGDETARDEEAIKTWRNRQTHRESQAAGRAGIFADYRLRIAHVVRDYGLNERAQAPQDSRVAHDRAPAL